MIISYPQPIFYIIRAYAWDGTMPTARDRQTLELPLTDAQDLHHHFLAYLLPDLVLEAFVLTRLGHLTVLYSHL